MLNLVRLWAVSGLILLTGCAGKHVGHTYLIDPNCLNKPVELKQCDEQEPPHCKQVTVNYKKGCEKLVVK